MIRGRISSEIIRIQARESESQTESRSYGPKKKKSELQSGRPPQSEPNHPGKGPERVLGASTENPLCLIFRFFVISAYSNGAVHIRVGLELADLAGQLQELKN